MKKLKILSSIVTVLLLMGISDCKQVAPEPKTELQKLPPATQLGKYTFGCLVNGKAFVTRTTLDVYASYQSGVMSIGGQRDDTDQSVFFSINDPNIVEGTTYVFDNKSQLTHFASYWILNSTINCDYETKVNNNTAQLTITKFDQVNLIVSGTFKMSLKLSGCEDVELTDGRFDLKYTR